MQQEKLAAKYDSWPLIREVAMTSCMSFTAEPFFSPSEDSVQKPIRAAGFTEAAYKECLRNGLADYAAWQDYKGFPLVPDAKLKRWAAMIEANKAR